MKPHPGRNLFTAVLAYVLLGMAGVVILLVVNSPRSPVSAHSGDVLGPACGMAVMDGQVGASEWAGASSLTFQMVVPGTGTPFTGTLRVMNGAYYLYYAFTVNDDEFSQQGQYLPRGDGVVLVFDNDHSGTLFQPGDDVLTINAGVPQFEDRYIVGTPVPGSNHNDTLGGGTTDGEGAAQRVHDLNHFEAKHPLCSGDPLDFCLHPGDTVGFRVEYLDAEGDGSFGGSQLFPGSSDTSEADIIIGDCSTIRDVFTFLPLVRKPL